jgi:hypothetical protein
MAALVAAIHFPEANGSSSWVAGTSPAMTMLFDGFEKHHLGGPHLRAMTRRWMGLW